MLFSSRFSASSLVLSACALALSPLAGQQVQYSTQHRNAERALPQTLSGGSKTLQAKLAGGRSGISLAVADFDNDNVQDLVTGYGLPGGGGALMLQRGLQAALSPTQNEVNMLAAGQFVAPYAAKAELIAVPVRPDLLETADVSGFGHNDLLVAAKGGSTVYLLAGKGDGTFLAPRALAFDGAVSALKAWRGPAGQNLLVASICGASGCGLQIMAADGTAAGFIPVGSPVSSFEVAAVNGGGTPDLLAIAGGKAFLIDGDSMLSGAPNLQTVMSGDAVAAAAGIFTYNLDGGTQIAVLDADATVHLFARGPLNLHQITREEGRARKRAVIEATSKQMLRARTTGVGWTEVETTPNFGPGTGAGAVPVLLHGHLSGSGSDDLVLMTKGQYFQLTHTSVIEGTDRKTTATVLVDTTTDPVTAAVATRLSPTAQLGVIALGGLHPQINPGAVYKTYTVNTNTDSATLNTTACVNGTAGCTLRSAVAQANIDAAAGHTGTTGADTISIPAGTYTLTASNGGSARDVNGDTNIHLDIDGGMNIMGTGANSSAVIIQTTNTSTTNQDNLFDIDSEVVNPAANFDVYVSNLTLQNGTNNDSYNNNGNFTGGLVDWNSDGSSALTMVNVVMTNGTSVLTNGGGGAVYALSLSASGNNPFELDNSTVTNSNATGQGGGGVRIYYSVQAIFKGDIFSGNRAAAGGAFVTATGDAFADVFTNIIVENNTATVLGGGASTGTGFTMSGSTFTGNTTAGSGGGIEASPATTTAIAINTSTFTGNKANTGNAATSTNYTDGGGICYETEGSGQPGFTLQYSRIYGNTGGQHRGLSIGCNGGSLTSVTAAATNNWWGCNNPPSGTNCDTTGVFTGGGSAPAPTTAPYTTLTLQLSATTINGGQSFTATGSLGQNSAGTAYSQANSVAYSGTTGTAAVAGSPGYTLPSTSQAELPVAASISIVQNGGYTTLTNTPGTVLTTISSPLTYAGIQAQATASQTGTGLASTTVDGCVIKDQGVNPQCGSATLSNFNITASDLVVTSTHSPSSFKAGDTADTYTLQVGNVGTGSTSGTVTVTDTLPTGFTATAAAGSGWTCAINSATSVTCTTSAQVSASVTFNPITLTVSVGSALSGTYTNNVAVSGGGEINTNNDTAADPTPVVAPPTISAAFSPTTVAPGAHPTLTFTITNPNTTALAGVGLVNNLPANLTNYTSTGGTCGGTSTTSTSQETLSGVTLAASSSCTFVVTVTAGSAIGTTTDTSNAVTSTSSNNGLTASASLTVAVTPTKLAYTTVPATPITAGGNAGTLSVALEDASGNVATNVSGTQVMFQVSTTGGYLQTYTSTVTNGVASLNLSSVPLTTAGTYTYTASYSGLTSAIATEIVNPGAAATFTVLGLSTFTAPQMSGTATVTARDAYGNVATGFTGTVTLSSTDASATFSTATYTYTASDAGVHAFTVTFNTAGNFNVTVTSGALTGSQAGIVVEDAIWLLNTNNLAVRLSDAGVQTGTAGTAVASGSSPTGAVAFDNAGYVWVTQNNNDAVARFSPAGVQQTITGNSSNAGISSPTSLFIDGLGQVWIANAGSNSISVLSNAGAPISPATAYQPGSFSLPLAILVDNSGSVWVANRTSSTITKVFGAGAATVAPTVTGTVNKTLGARP